MFTPERKTSVRRQLKLGILLTRFKPLAQHTTLKAWR